MDNLPDDILMQIFEQFSLQQRKKIRLVCRRWNRICYVASITKLEKILINYFDEPSVVFESLLKSERRVFHLEIYSTDVALNGAANQSLFWRIQGAKIKSLNFRQCFFDDGVLCEVLKYCTNLADFTVSYPVRSQPLTRSFFTNLERLRACNVTAPTVSSFKLTLCFREMLANSHVNMVNVVFPNLTEFAVTIKGGCRSFAASVDKVDVLSARDFSYTSISHLIGSTKSRLKNLKIRVFFPLGSLPKALHEDMVNTLAQQTQLEKIDIYELMNRASRQSIDKLWSLKNINTLNLHRSNFKECGYTLHDFMLRILDSFPRLRHLKLGYFHTTNIDQTLIEKIFASSLQTLKFRLTRPSGITEADVPQNLQPNETLEELTIGNYDVIDNDGLYERLLLVFVKFCKNLLYLNVQKPTDTVLQNIFQYQKRLQCLLLINCRKCSDIGFTGIQERNETDAPQTESYSFRELKELKRLKIKLDFSANQTEKIFSCFDFPKLTTLWILIKNEFYIDWYETFSCAIKRLQHLQYLEIHYSNEMSFDKILRLCQVNRNLRLICVNDENTNQFTDDEYKKCFEECHSLKYLLHNGIRYYRNTISRRIEPIEKQRLCCYFTQRIGCHKISKVQS